MNSKQNPDADDHWRRLAAELGLEVEPPARTAPEPPPAEAAPPPKFAEPHEEFVAAEAPPEWSPAPQEFAAPGLVEEEFLEQTTQSGADELSPIETSPADADPADEKPRRRRRRPRRKKGETAADQTTRTPDDHVQDEDDDPTAEVVKDWNIPSWNELIASLYRPDR
jgi:hypothetical protein